MKLRILDNYIRLRLNQTEVDNYMETGKVSSQSQIGLNALNYQLVKSPKHTDVIAEFVNNTITIYVPAAVTEKWSSPDEVGFKNENQSEIKILVEKDFQCLHKRPEEDESDSYPNPLAINN
ncbi:DUF7009 family protein [Reichenbachiella versicolor]|uniref:DUF7009 family protein n=1 Tax=Reichenbachiella versicolor TaxID=1821036 RepID=UPI000D6E168F|nr:hypothetical protein [Reichenbachiella versicolor]